MEPLTAMAFVAVLGLGLAIGSYWPCDKCRSTQKARSSFSATGTQGLRKFRTVEVAGAHYVERWEPAPHREWFRLVPEYPGRWMSPDAVRRDSGERPLWRQLPFTCVEDAHAAMIAEAGRELAEVPIVKAEL